MMSEICEYSEDCRNDATDVIVRRRVDNNSIIIEYWCDYHVKNIPTGLAIITRELPYEEVDENPEPSSWRV